MPDVKIPYGLPGVAAFELSELYVNSQLLRGSHPALSPAIPGTAGAVISRFHVVGFSAGELVPATWNADPDLAVKPVGVAALAAADGADTLYHYSGHFNMDELVFDATFNTPAKKIAAFDGSPTPTNIRVSPRFG